MTYEECERLVDAYGNAVLLSCQVDADGKEYVALDGVCDALHDTLSSLVYEGFKRKGDE